MLVYDANGNNPSNLIPNEVHTPITGPHIAPVEGVFYTKDFVVEGRLVAGNTYIPLTVNSDYIYSPQFITRTAVTGLEAYSYILLVDYTRWSHIRLTYRGSGGSADTVLMAEIVTAGDFDVTNITLWQSFVGELVSIVPGGPELDPRATSTVFLLASRMNAIALALGTPSQYLTFITNNLTDMLDAIQSLQASVDDLEVGGNGGSGSLVNYSTTAQINVAIEEARALILDIAVQQQTANMSWYVNGANVGTEDGLTAPTGFTTLTKALKATMGYLANGKQKKIYVSNGTYSANTVFNSNIPDDIAIIGNIANPELCILDCSFAVAGCPVSLSGVTLQNTHGGGCIKGVQNAIFNLNESVVFGDAPSGWHVHMQNSTVVYKFPVEIKGDALRHMVLASNSTWGIHCDNIILTDTPNFSDGFIYCVDKSNVSPIVPTGTFTGSATGVQYYTDWSSQVNLINPATPYPGDLPPVFLSKRVPQLTSDLTIYVDETADPLIANGLTLGTAFTTIEEGYQALRAYDHNGYQAVISIAPGSYAGLQINNTRGDLITIRGSGAPGSVILTSQLWLENGVFELENINPVFNNVSGQIYARWNTKVDMRANMKFGENTTGPHLKIVDNAFVIFRDPYTIDGSATEHAHIGENGTLAWNTDGITVNGTLNFSNAFVFVRNYSRIRPYAGTVAFNVTGTVTGKRYIVNTLSIVNSSGNGPNWLPGDVAGEVDTTGALYI